MAPLNPNATDRLKITYQNAIAEHTCMIRIASSADIEGAGDDFIAVVAEVSLLFCVSEVTGVQYAATGVDVFNDVEVAALNGFTWGAATATKDTNPVAGTFVGRSGAGRRARFSLFGFDSDLSEYRLTSGENASVLNAVNLLNGYETTFLAIDGLPVIWKGYMDIKANDHWVGKSRG